MRVLTPGHQEANLERHYGFYLSPRLLRGRSDLHLERHLSEGFRNRSVPSSVLALEWTEGREEKSMKYIDKALVPAVVPLERTSILRTLLVPA